MYTADKELIENLYTQYYLWLKNRAYKIINDADESEDIVHDCMINAYRHIECLRALDERKQKAYLAAAVDNLSRNYLSRQKKRVIPTENECEISDSESIELLIEHRIIVERVLSEISRMNRRDKTAIELKYILGMHDRAIASVLGIKENSVRMTVRRSIFRLKKQLGVIRKHEPIQ